MQVSLRLRIATPLHARARSVSSSAPSSKSSFFLNTYRSAEDGENATPSNKYLRMIMFGKPGAGKGTLSSRLVKNFNILSLSTGDLLRQHIAEKTDVGREAEEIVAQGGLLPDEVVLKVVTSKLDQLQNKHWILDGFPRTLSQAELLDAHLKDQNMPLTLVVNLQVPDQVILSRISDRWVHLQSGRVYNMSYNRPKVDGFDDVTGEPLTKRPDDNPEIFARRLAEFYKSTSPLLAYYTEAATAPPSRVPRNPNLHPHQLSFPQTQPRLRLRTLTGSTSDEIWPQLQQTVRATTPSLKGKSSDATQLPHSLSDPFVVSGKPLAAGLRN
ncbi:adenylate kinase [Pluteus cervinus]|uniref:Adenylate kinase n=1 Tax=Pluteus cervinus TaxID=181527 RepID=A0ACD3BFI7_9AGAR|nr:adenylate kinase [Pluteus cervinus]